LAAFNTLHLEGFPLGTYRGFDGAGLRALAAAPLPNLTSLMLSRACLSAADVSGVFSSAPWLAGLICLELACNHLGAPGHRALSLLHLPRLRALSLDRNGFEAGFSALASASWLTQLRKLTFEDFISGKGCDDIGRAVSDDACVFGRLQRLGCILEYRLTMRCGGSPASELESDPGSDQGDG
jgi:hypothetical protein